MNSTTHLTYLALVRIGNPDSHISLWPLHVRSSTDIRQPATSRPRQITFTMEDAVTHHHDLSQTSCTILPSRKGRDASVPPGRAVHSLPSRETTHQPLNQQPEPFELNLKFTAQSAPSRSTHNPPELNRGHDRLTHPLAKRCFQKKKKKSLHLGHSPDSFIRCCSIRSTMASAFVFSDVRNSHVQDIHQHYATRFLDLRGIVCYHMLS
ncbi:uncharacterized protein BDZ83DRAFT_621729 [Colletotrichum acutatum]|uniref:Uncharacterized protein n=1 Tax=Glomerella acutata TaxID=27357 RepID=A0AAD8XEF0_GLOAC|nr:uncharacterized protein BDZ83DRAFT_621729 [Colletotrichum acutatum]KAK1724724.1 hypothetical protein BDZ83DRAFT_621729 [Colletotrichum acutatum]